MDALSIYQAIYTDVFCNTYQQTCYVFLCGGAGKDHVRNKIRVVLERMQFQVLYPEDLFMDMFNRNKKADLLEFENFLADNADIICVICESMGSAVELGAFVQSENIRNKMVVAINQKYARDKSFIMMGPVKHIGKNNPNQIITCKHDDPEAFGDALAKSFHKLLKKSSYRKADSFEKLSSYIALLPLIIYFFQQIPRRQLFQDLKKFISSVDPLPSEYNELFNVSIKFLLKTGVLVTDFSDDKNGSLSLSPKGLAEVRAVLSCSTASNKSLLHDRIRCDIMKEQLKN